MNSLSQQAIMEIHASLDSAELYFTLNRHLGELFGIHRYSIFLFNNDSQQYNLDFSTVIDSSYWDEIFFDQNDVFFEFFAGDEPSPIPSQLTWFGNEYDLYWINILYHGDEIALAFIAHEPLDDFTTIAAPLQLYFDHLCLSLIKAKLYEEMRDIKEENAAKLDAINEMGELLGNLELERIMVKLMELSLKILTAEVGSIMLYNDEHELETTIEWGLKDEFIKSITLSEEKLLVDQVAANREVCHIEDLPHDPNVSVGNSLYSVNSIISFPLFTQNKTYGVINIINQEGSTHFDSREIETLKTVAQLASIAIENAVYHQQALEQEKLMEQLRIAGEIQRSLLPQKNPAIKGLDISGISIPAVNVGGDFFDYIETPEHKLCVVIGDVAGKGIPAALLMAMTKSMIRSNIQEPCSNRTNLPQGMRSVNNFLARENLEGKFVTALVYILDLVAMKVHLLSAGHTPLHIFRPRENEVKTWNDGGLPFGVLENESYRHLAVDIKPGDILLIYTDGITEAHNRNSELFGTRRLEQLIMKNADQNAETIRDVVVKEVARFAHGEPQFDDLTLVVAKISEDIGRPE
ncbi:MAG: SpoIIE family protein phosphatase [Deltaproteobacteria bacterium]|nr:SpoIIE family protein phosphatase [Candidatus Anaeroferrophillus wilburensis]MBN2888034.1 SpoIIE family protein phosphatase [Deltaproteobacteria bacterium]